MTQYDIITYLVSCRRSIEIWRVCKIYGRRGGAEPSIYFTNPPYFYRPSATDQISVLFRRGPWIMYVVAKIGKKSMQIRLHTYTAEFCARKCDVTTCADDVIDYAMKIKDETMLCFVKIKEEIDVSPLLKLHQCKSEVNRNKRMSFLFLIQSEHILVSRRSHSNGDVVRHLGFLNKFFAYWRSIREVYSVIDRLHVTCFIQWVCDILVRGEINSIVMSRQLPLKWRRGPNLFVIDFVTCWR